MNRKPWTDADLWRLIAWYPETPIRELCRRLERTPSSIYRGAHFLAHPKDPEFLRRQNQTLGHKLQKFGRSHQFPKGHVPANAGLRRPGWFSGRMRETQFKKGHFPFNRDPEFYVLGALRVNTDGYIDMRVSFDKGSKGWRALHRILWEDAHGSVPPGYFVSFKDGDRLNVELRNLKLISLADNMRRNTLHNLPKPLVSTIQLLGALKRTLNRRRRNEEQNRRSA